MRPEAEQFASSASETASILVSMASQSLNSSGAQERNAEPAFVPADRILNMREAESEYDPDAKDTESDGDSVSDIPNTPAATPPARRAGKAKGKGQGQGEGKGQGQDSPQASRYQAISS